MNHLMFQPTTTKAPEGELSLSLSDSLDSEGLYDENPNRNTADGPEGAPGVEDEQKIPIPGKKARPAPEKRKSSCTWATILLCVLLALTLAGAGYTIYRLSRQITTLETTIDELKLNLSTKDAELSNLMSTHEVEIIELNTTIDSLNSAHTDEIDDLNDTIDKDNLRLQEQLNDEKRELKKQIEELFDRNWPFRHTMMFGLYLKTGNDVINLLVKDLFDGMEYKDLELIRGYFRQAFSDDDLRVAKLLMENFSPYFWISEHKTRTDNNDMLFDERKIQPLLFQKTVMESQNEELVEYLREEERKFRDVLDEQCQLEILLLESRESPTLKELARGIKSAWSNGRTYTEERMTE